MYVDVLLALCCSVYISHFDNYINFCNDFILFKKMSSMTNYLEPFINLFIKEKQIVDNTGNTIYLLNIDADYDG